MIQQGSEDNKYQTSTSLHQQLETQKHKTPKNSKKIDPNRSMDT